MSERLQAIVDEFDSAERRLHALAARVPAERWTMRSDPARWSVGECVGHLNLTSEAYLPIIDAALQRARELPRRAGPYRHDLPGWLLWRVMGPPVRFRAKTAPAFVPVAGTSSEQLISEFDRLQREQIERVREADGLPLSAVKIVSPFNDRVKYNLYSCFAILPRHQHRHLWQAERSI